jgi:RNA polymerase sigma-70 factor (ECF subfamily)
MTDIADISAAADYRGATEYEKFEAEALSCYADVSRYALSLARNEHDADDLVQETYARALRYWERFAPGSNCRAWLFTICRNWHYRRWERERRHIDHLELFRRQPAEYGLGSWSEFDLDARLEAIDIHTYLVRALAALPEPFRRVVELVHLEDRTYDEAAASLGIAVGTVRSRLHRARALLRRTLTGDLKQSA